MNTVSSIMVPHPPLIIPEIGRGQEQAIRETTDSCKKAAELLKSGQPDTIVMLSPHSALYADYFHISPGASARGSFSQFGAGSVRFEVKYDEAFVSELSRLADEAGLSAGTLGERTRELDHATMVPLHFIRQAYGQSALPQIVRIGLSGLSYERHYQLGMLIRDAARRLNRSISVVASGDLSHRLKPDGPYGFKPEGPEYDARIMDVMERAAFDELFDFPYEFCETAGECGHRSFVIMAGCFDGVGVSAARLSYQGPFGVGYGVCTFVAKAPDETRHFLERRAAAQNTRLAARKQREDAHVRLARQALEAYVNGGKVIAVPANLPSELLDHRAGTFVSLKKHGQLRGCIGTIRAVTASIAEEIIRNAVSACSEDPRFDPVTPEELQDLVYSVDVLGDAQDISSPEQLDVKRYGVIVTSGRKRGLLLPNLEGIDTVDEQIAIARQKAGIAAGEKVSLQRFEVTRHA